MWFQQTPQGILCGAPNVTPSSCPMSWLGDRFFYSLFHCLLEGNSPWIRESDHRQDSSSPEGNFLTGLRTEGCQPLTFQQLLKSFCSKGESVWHSPIPLNHQYPMWENVGARNTPGSQKHKTGINIKLPSNTVFKQPLGQ